MTGDAAFYEPLGEGRYRATRATIGPWSEGLQHAGPPSALLAHVLERLSPRPGARIARLSVELLGPVEVGEMAVTAAVDAPVLAGKNALVTSWNCPAPRLRQRRFWPSATR